MWDRTERVEALMKERIATIVLERLSDPRLGFITITGVKLSGDKRLAKVAFTVLGSAAQRRTTERALRDAASHVQQVLAPSMRMRNMPELRFVYDESIEKESKMLELLDGLQAERGERGDDGAEGGAEGGASDNVGQPAAPDDDDDVIDEPS
ncbi:MAG TPA: 30S ribosome-binding factor RbfA [Planctomycetota bacterium]|nr:30S ribosome-binding factor RbfA [Planctomycetota bacterium]